MVFWVEKRFDDLFSEIKKIEKYYPEDETAAYYKALTICQLDYPISETIPVLKDILKNNKSDPYIINAIAYEYLKSDNSKDAEKWFLNSLKVTDMKDTYTGLIKAYFRMNQKTKINAIFRKYLKIYNDDNVMRKYFITNLYEQKNYKSAIKEIEKYNLYTAGNSRMEYMLAKCYLKTENFKKAIVLYRKILSENPDNVNFLMSYSYCLENIGKSNDALNILEKSLTYFKNNSRIMLTAGVMYFREKKYEKAMD